MTPVKVSIRTYQVGFGDCFLMSIAYDDASEKHVLIDFGTTKLPENVPKSQMLAIARDIQKRSGGKLTAVVATHRHQDHISGFGTTAAGSGPGAIIAGCDPDLVLQPWTEHPDLAVDATELKLPSGAIHSMAAASRSLAAMQSVARHYVGETTRNASYLRTLDKGLREELKFIGEDNIQNASAVANLIAMGHQKGRGEYLNAGKPTRLADLLGVQVLVLGPPTVKQHERVARQKSRDPEEYWQLAAAAPAAILDSASGKAQPLFPGFVAGRTSEQFPIDTRYLIARARRLRGEQMLSIVRTLDQAMNNTSLILLFTIGSKSFLFPGDAQIENWEFALNDPAWMKKLAAVDVYKVGHHGSLNATPKTLWKNFRNKSESAADPKRLQSLMSTLEGKHGKPKDGTEVPRTILVDELKKESNLFSTQSLAASMVAHDLEVDVR